MSNKTNFQEKNTRLNANNTDLNSILNIINNLPEAGSGEVAKNIFSNDYSQIGYAGNYIASDGYTLTDVLWSDLTPYTGQSATWYVTNPIPIESDTFYRYSGFSSGNNPACCFLGEDKETIYTGIIYKGEGCFYTPKEAKYIVMSVAQANVETMEIYEDSPQIVDLINNQLTEYKDESLKSIASYGLAYKTALKTIDLPNVTTVADRGFMQCTSCTSINLPALQTTGTFIFNSMTALEEVVLPEVTNMSHNCFVSCSNIKKVDFHKITYFGFSIFSGCTNFETLIVRTPSVAQISSSNLLNNTKIANGEGYIYVPDDLVEDYKVATNWSNYANQIKGLSELGV